MSEQEDRHPLDDCPGCGAPMALVLAVLGGPERPGGGAFRSCPTCGELYARAGADRRWLNRRGYRLLAREILRLRALVPPDQQHARSTVRSVVGVEDGDPALPRSIGEAAERHRRQRGLGAGAAG